MADQRAYIKIEFHMHGKAYKTEFDINYFDNGHGFDDRVEEWFRQTYNTAQASYEVAHRVGYPDRRGGKPERRESTN